jgi:Oxidoreductase family, NAD-binding Rossmann fold
MRLMVVGAGAVGARAARQLATTDGVTSLVVADVRAEQAEAVTAGLGPMAAAVGLDELAFDDRDGLLLATPAGGHAALAARALGRGCHVVSTADTTAEVRALLALDRPAMEAGRHVVVGAAFSPGLSCLLAAHAADSFDRVDEIHVARTGTGGPACARAHFNALGGSSHDWIDGELVPRAGRSGRELCWFPDPIGGVDCYRADLPDPELLGPAFLGVSRVTARLGATRRDRLTARLPMLWPPHAEGGLGGVRVEVRGRRDAGTDVLLYGAMDRPAVAAGGVSAIALVEAVRGRLGPHGAHGLATVDDPVPLLQQLAARGVTAATFEGTG